MCVCVCVCVCVFVCVIYMYNYGVYKLINTGQCYSWTILRPGSRSLCSSLVVIVVYTSAWSRWWSLYPLGKSIKKQWSIFPSKSWSLIREA